MAKGTVRKHCSCTDNTGKRLRAKCPRLRRHPGGPWHPTHGVWAYQLELPTTPDGRRSQLRRSGFTTREQAQTELDHAKQLLQCAGGDPQAAAQIAGLIRACTPGSPLPDRDRVARRIRGPVNGTPTFGQYLHHWVAGRGHVAANTMRCYRDHIHLYLDPHLGH